MKTTIISLGKSETIKGCTYRKVLSDNTVVKISEKEYITELKKINKKVQNEKERTENSKC